MQKHFIKISILAIWLGLMGWWWHESRSWPVPEKIDAAFLPDFYDHFSLTFNDQRVGWVYKSLRRQSDGGYQGAQGTTVQVKVGDKTLIIQSNVLVNMDRSLNLIDFQYLLQAGDLAVSEKGMVSGGYLSVTVSLGEYAPLMKALAEEFGPMLGSYAGLLDFDKEVVLPAPDGPAVAAVFPPFLSHLGLAEGRNYALTTLDPLSRAMTVTNLRVESISQEYDKDLGRNQPVYKIRIGSGGQETFMWIDPYGRTLREEGLGFALTRVENELAAVSGITPLTPPAAFQRLLSGPRINELMQIIEARQAERKRKTD